jgi:hypothetical protein
MYEKIFRCLSTLDLITDFIYNPYKHRLEFLGLSD